jgi:polygalacturonase/predicted esterase
MSLYAKPLWLLVLLCSFCVALAVNTNSFEAKVYETEYGESLNYRLHSPIATRNTEKYPLVLFLHGAGERGRDNTLQLKYGVDDILAFSKKNNHPIYMLAPQCPSSQQWVNVPWNEDSHTMPENPSTPMRLTLELMDTLIKNLPIDPNRLYVTGLSMGGFGTFDVIQRRPEQFAAALPICGGGDTKLANIIKGIPLWIAHGDMDPIVSVMRARDMVDTLELAGASPRYTEYHDAGHSTWGPTYRNDVILNWLFSQVKTSNLNTIQKMTRRNPVEIPDYSVSIVAFGARQDNAWETTKAFKKAFDSCMLSGGGHVIVPPGIWPTGPIQLRSRVDLHLKPGAVIQFSDRFDDYPLINTTWEGLPRVRCVSPLFGNNLTNVSITGQGIIDGAGQAWRPVKKFKVTAKHWKTLIESGGVLNDKEDVWWPNQEALNGPELVQALEERHAILRDYAPLRAYLRPVMVSLINCKNVLLDGPTFQNSPAWNIHPLLCEDVTIRNITVRNPWFSQNGDGLDLESCRNVTVSNSTFDVGDDAICLKSGKNEYGRKRGKACENIVITDCTVYHGHGGITIGSEMSGGVKNVFIDNCTFLGTDVGLRFKSTRGRGGVVENIHIQNVRMSNIATDAISFNTFYGGAAPKPIDNSYSATKVKVDESTPQFKNILIKNVLCEGANRAIWIQGLPEMAIQGIRFEKIHMTAKQGMVSIDANQIILKEVKIKTQTSPTFALFNNHNVVFDQVYRLTASIMNEAFLLVDKNSSHIMVDSIDIARVSELISQ